MSKASPCIHWFLGNPFVLCLVYECYIFLEDFFFWRALAFKFVSISCLSIQIRIGSLQVLGTKDNIQESRYDSPNCVLQIIICLSVYPSIDKYLRRA